MERGFGTHQDRLVKELRLAGIATLEQANALVRDVYLPKHNRQFAVATRPIRDAHRTIAGYDLAAILAMKAARIVTNDFTIRYKARWFQLTPRQRTIVRPKHTVTVVERLDGRVSLRHGRTMLSFTEVSKQPPRLPQPVRPPITPRQPWKPPVNHPWRTAYQPVTVLLSTTR